MIASSSQRDNCILSRSHSSSVTDRLVRDEVRRTNVNGLLVAAAAVGFSLGAPPAGAQEARPQPPTPLALKGARVQDPFWTERLTVLREKTIPHSWTFMQHEIRALKRASGVREEGDLNGTWGEANLWKFVETCAHALAQHPDPALEKSVDEVIAMAAAAQRPDGYVHAYMINNAKEPWGVESLAGAHDGYVLGHLIEAAIEYHAATGKRTLLDVAVKAALQAHERFLGPRGRPGFCGHAELEMALVELHRAAPDRRFLDLARAFVEWKGRGLGGGTDDRQRAYQQDHLPIRQQTSLEGHAVRAVFFATGVADLAIQTGDPDYRLASHRFWDSAARRRMTVTGSVGPRRDDEAFGGDYELPDDGYYESCAACGMADFAHRMLLLEGRAEFADVLERILYNGVLHGLSLDGTSSYYQNPLSDRDNPRYNSWVCCPPNLSRTVLQVSRYAYAWGRRDVYAHLFVGGQFDVPLPSGVLRKEVRSEMPWAGRVTYRFPNGAARPFRLHVRIPAWCAEPSLRLNGRRLEPLPRAENGYAVVERAWAKEDELTLTLPMPILRIEAHPNLRGSRGKVALQRGPLIYAFEGLDNGGSAPVRLGVDPALRVEQRADLLGGLTVMAGTTAEGRPLTAIPFYALANRQKSSQEVWAVQEGLPEDPWWQGKLYRPVAGDATGRPIGWWKFDEAAGGVAGDSSGLGHRGLLRPAAFTLDSAGGEGRLGRALRFDGATPWVEVEPHRRFDLAAGFTAAAWVRLPKDPAPDGMVLSKSGAWGLSLPGGRRLKFFTWGDDAEKEFSFVADRWHHVAGVHAGSERRFYVDGARIGTAPAAPAPLSAAGLRIGDLDIGVAGKRFRGAIDDVRIYARALSDAEVRALWQDGE